MTSTRQGCDLRPIGDPENRLALHLNPDVIFQSWDFLKINENSTVPNDQNTMSNFEELFLGTQMELEGVLRLYGTVEPIWNENITSMWPLPRRVVLF